eukprot:805243_1
MSSKRTRKSGSSKKKHKSGSSKHKTRKHKSPTATDSGIDRRSSLRSAATDSGTERRSSLRSANKQAIDPFKPPFPFGAVASSTHKRKKKHKKSAITRESTQTKR